MAFRELDNLLVYEFLKNFGISLIGIFIPVYIVASGEGLLSAALFIVLSGFAGIFLSYPLARLISEIGFKHSLISSYLFLIPGILIIRVLEVSFFVIVLSSLLYNIGRLIHNISLNSEFAVDSNRKKRSEDSGKMLSLPSLSRLIAPLMGGIIFAGLGFGQLMVFSVLILALSALPLLLSEEHRDPMKYDIEMLLSDEYLRTLPLFIIRGIQAVAAVDIFGLFVFMLIGGTVDVGGARALDSLGFVLTGLIVGRYAKKINKDLFVGIGCLGFALAFFVRGFLTTPLQVFWVSFLGGIFFQIYHIPVYSSFADEAEKKDILEFYTLRKIFVSFGNILTVAILSLFFLLYDLRTAFIATFTLGGLTTLLMALIYWNDPGLA